MKLTVFILIEIALSYIMAAQFCGKLEVASATRANKEDGTKTRSLELGYTGRAILMVVIFVEFALIALLSKWLVVGTLVAMIISVGIVWANIYLRGVGIEALIPMFLLWIGNVVASLYQQSKVGTESGWASFYIIFEIIMLVLLLAGTAIVKFNQYRRMHMDEEDEADEIDEDVDHMTDEPEDEESEDESTDEGEDDDEDADDYWEREERKEQIIRTALNGLIIVLIIAAVVAIGYWLEVKFDFLPPYRI